MSAEESDCVMRLFGAASDSIVDGPGLRFSVFVQGCSHQCPGCHNKGSWPIDGGQEYSIDQVEQRIRENKLIHDVTLSGGEPFEQAPACAELARRLKADGYGIWVYTGYLYENLLECAAGKGPLADALVPDAVGALLESADVLVDGPFVESLHSYDLNWRGSSNQRVIDLVKTRKSGEVVLWEQSFTVPKRPSSW